MKQKQWINGLKGQLCTYHTYFRPKKILDSQTPPHCPQSPRITDFFKPKKKKNSALKNLLFRFVHVRPIFNIHHTFTRSSENWVGAWYWFFLCGLVQVYKRCIFLYNGTPSWSWEGTFFKKTTWFNVQHGSYIGPNIIRGRSTPPMEHFRRV